MTDYKSLLAFCSTPRQTEVLEAVIECGGIRPAARKLNIKKSGIDGMLKMLKVRAAQRSIPEHKNIIPDGFKIKGTSTLYKDGEEVLQWVKTTTDAERIAQFMEESYKAMSETLPRELPVVREGYISAPALLNFIPIADGHIGMLAWGVECGDDWDVKIAEQTICDCFRQLIMQMPAAKECVIANLGDLLHFDGLEAVTPTAHNILDADGRFSKVVQAAIRVIRKILALALSTYEKVNLVICEGNHDLASSVWLRQMFLALMENEPRITVADGEGPYYVHQHGEVMLVMTHGHTKKFTQLPAYIPAAFPKMWGNTKYRYAHVGHYHTTHEQEANGITIIQHATLAAKDAYAHRHGWLSNRSITGTTYHKEYGQVARTTITPEMIK